MHAGPTRKLTGSVGRAREAGRRKIEHGPRVLGSTQVRHGWQCVLSCSVKMIEKALNL